MNEEEEKLQQKYIEMKMLEEQMTEIQKHGQKVEQQIMELMGSVQSIEDFKKTNVGDEILVPISSGVFAKAELKENKELLVNVGSDTIVKKDIDSTKKLISDQVEQIRDVHTKITMQIQKMSIQASSTESELKELASKVQ
jgi:prefoldin alpha subunit